MSSSPVSAQCSSAYCFPGGIGREATRRSAPATPALPRRESPFRNRAGSLPVVSSSRGAVQRAAFLLCKRKGGLRQRQQVWRTFLSYKMAGRAWEALRGLFSTRRDCELAAMVSEWIAIEPTPPAPPRTSRERRSLSRPRRNPIRSNINSQAVSAVSGSAAASAKPRDRRLLADDTLVDQMKFGCWCPAASSIPRNRRGRPGRSRELPRAAGDDDPRRRRSPASWPRPGASSRPRRFTSTGFTETARTSTRRSWPDGSGRSNSMSMRQRGSDRRQRLRVSHGAHRFPPESELRWPWRSSQFLSYKDVIHNAADSAAGRETSMAVLITGGTKGVGLAIARRFAAAGRQVFLAYRQDAAAAASRGADRAAGRARRGAAGRRRLTARRAPPDRGGRRADRPPRLVVHGAVKVLVGPLLELDPVELAEAITMQRDVARVPRAGRAAAAAGAAAASSSFPAAAAGRSCPCYGAIGAGKALAESLGALSRAGTRAARRSHQLRRAGNPGHRSGAQPVRRRHGRVPGQRGRRQPERAQRHA